MSRTNRSPNRTRQKQTRKQKALRKYENAGTFASRSYKENDE